MSILRLDNVSYHYAGVKKKVLEHLSYTFEKGQMYSIIGRSGAGKTTLLSLISGLAAPTDGRSIWKIRILSRLISMNTEAEM